LTCYVILPAGKVAMGKLAQALMHGAKVISVKGNFDQALNIVMGISTKMDIYLLNSITPWRLEGQKTLAFEVVDQLGHVPEVVAVPMGNCGNISAIWKGFKEFEGAGVTGSLPKMFGVQAAGSAPVVRMLRENLSELAPINSPETVATAIRIGNPVNWPKAVKAIQRVKRDLRRRVPASRDHSGRFHRGTLQLCRSLCEQEDPLGKPGGHRDQRWRSRDRGNGHDHFIGAHPCPVP